MRTAKSRSIYRRYLIAALKQNRSFSIKLGIKQLMAGGGIALIGMVLVPVLGRTSDQGGRMGLPSFFFAANSQDITA